MADPGCQRRTAHTNTTSTHTFLHAKPPNNNNQTTTTTTHTHNTQVRAGLVPLIADIKSRGKAPDASWLSGDYDEAKQADLCKEIALDMGFDLDRGRLDVSVHPFTGGAHVTDVRMTTRFKRGDLTEGLTGGFFLFF